MKEYDVLIIGAGQAGIPLARTLSDKKWRVAIAEQKHLGGSCVNFGCTPTKAVFASARVAHMARRAADFGVVLPEPKIDFAKVLGRARGIVEASKASLAKGLDDSSADLLWGHARLTGRDENVFTIAIDGETVRAKQVVIDTGARTLLPSIEGLEEVPFLHAGNWLDSQALPDHVIFAGAGYIALEMAQFYRRMGARATVVGPDNQVVKHEDADVALALQRALENEGVVFRLNARVKEVRPDGHAVRVIFESAGKDESVTGSHLFIATGRRPNTDDIGLKTVGVKVNNRGVIEVDDRLATSVPGIWAAGDVRGGPMFTHTAWDDYRILESQLLGDVTHTKAGRIIPYAIFTDPELGRVGMTEGEARRKHGDHVKVATFEMRFNGKATELGEPSGFIKLVGDSRDGRLLGAAVLAVEGAELAAIYITLMNARATIDAICNGIYIHPTLAEAAQSAALALKLQLESEMAAS